MNPKIIIPHLPTITSSSLKEYTLKTSSYEYSLKIGKTSATGFMIFILKSPNDEKNCYHISEYCLNDLLDLSKTFWIYDSINDAIKDIEESCIKKTPIVSKNKNGELCLEINFETYRNIDDIKFVLTKKYVDDNVVNDSEKNDDEIFKKSLDLMKNEIKNLKNEIDNLKNILENNEQNFNEKCKLIEEKISKEKKDINTIKEKDDVINKLIKRIETLENNGKKFEEFMKTKGKK